MMNDTAMTQAGQRMLIPFVTWTRAGLSSRMLAELFMEIIPVRSEYYTHCEH